MKTLIVIDMQNDFITGALKNEAAEALIPALVEKVKSWEGPVIFTRDTHYENLYDYTLEGKKLPVKHCIQGTEGWMIEKSLAAVAGEKFTGIVDKETFGYVKWDEEGNKTFVADADEIVLTGVCTDICVISNAIILRALWPNKKITILKDLCAGTTKENHKAALTIARNCQIDVE